jgi:hypothetical protein
VVSPSSSLVFSLSLPSLSCCGLCAMPPGVSGAPAVRSTWAQALYRGREQQGRWERRYSEHGCSQAFSLFLSCPLLVVESSCSSA